MNRSIAGTQAWTTNPRVLLAMLLALGLLAMQTGRGTLAFFTDAVASSGNTFTAADLRIQVNGQDNTGTATVSFNTATTALKPTDTRYALISVALVTGSVNSDIVSTVYRTRAAITTSHESTLSDNLDGRLNFTVADVTANTTAVTTSAGCVAGFSAAGSAAVTLLTGTLDDATATASRAGMSVSSATPDPFFNVGTGITAGTTKKYCVKVDWPSNATTASATVDNPAKLGSDVYTLTFTGTQS